jgi:cytochrome c oxidase cbb3-type subunit 2
MIRWLAPLILPLALWGCEPGNDAIASVSRERAEALFLRNCAICHGEKGDGYGPRRGSLFRKPPDFRQPAWRRGRSLEQIRASIRNGRPGSDMPAWKLLDDAEVAGLAAYVSDLATRDESGPG